MLFSSVAMICTSCINASSCSDLLIQVLSKSSWMIGSSPLTPAWCIIHMSSLSHRHCHFMNVIVVLYQAAITGRRSSPILCDFELTKLTLHSCILLYQ